MNVSLERTLELGSTRNKSGFSVILLWRVPKEKGELVRGESAILGERRNLEFPCGKTRILLALSIK